MKRVFFGIVIALALFFAAPAQAAPPPTTPTPPVEPPATKTGSWKWETPTSFGASIQGDDVNLGASWHVGMQDSMYSFTCLGIGLACTDQAADVLPYIHNSAAGTLATAIGSTFSNKPADFGLWLADTGRTLGFLPNQVMAQGQGIGFTGLTPLLPIWKAFRNIAYLLMAIVMMVLGFLIMFRKKIDPKTVVTAQNAIPRVVISLFLITFSYAIVGIMIDIMYMILFFAIALFTSAGLQNPTSPWNGLYGVETSQDLYGASGLMANFANVEVNPWKLFGIQSIPFIDLTKYDLVAGIVGIVAAIAGFSSGGGALVGVGGVLLAAMPVIHLILTVLVIFLFIRLLAFFLTAYVQIIISLLLGPLQFLAEAFPGSNAFSSWFKNLIANLAVFPIGGAMFMLSALFTQFSNDPKASIWQPPYTALGGNNVSIASLLSLGILFAIPSVAGSIKEALKAKSLIGLPGGESGGGGGIAQWLSSAYYIRSLAPQDWINRLTNKQSGGGGGGGGGQHS